MNCVKNLFNEEEDFMREFLSREKEINKIDLFYKKVVDYEVSDLSTILSKKLDDIESDSDVEEKMIENEKVEEKRFIMIEKDKVEEKELTEILKQENLSEEVKKHENNQKKVRHMGESVKLLKLNFYLNCEKCSNTVSATVNPYQTNALVTWSCSEHCNGCFSVFCYECMPRVERFCEINLGSKMIPIRNPTDLRTNTKIKVDNFTKNGSNYCEKCSFKKLSNGDCMLRVKEWEKLEKRK